MIREDLVSSAVRLPQSTLLSFSHTNLCYQVTCKPLQQFQMTLSTAKKWPSAVLQDPSVAASTLDKRIAFLKSKNLTQEEIDTSLARAGAIASSTPDAPPPSPPPPPPSQNGYGYTNNQMMRQPAYGVYPYAGQWGPPPEYALQHGIAFV